jgi:hypothetical protein
MFITLFEAAAFIITFGHTWKSYRVQAGMFGGNRETLTALMLKQGKLLISLFANNC